jgi:hypothetical protein
MGRHCEGSLHIRCKKFVLTNAKILTILPFAAAVTNVLWREVGQAREGQDYVKMTLGGDLCGLSIDLLLKAAEVDGKLKHEHVEAGIAQGEQLFPVF